MLLVKKHGKKVIRLPALAAEILANIPAHFVDDGCSSSPDSWFGYDFRWACRIHDYMWCTRAHALGTMTKEWKLKGDLLLRRCIAAALPRRWRWLSFLYYRGVRRAAWPFNTCQKGDTCRHGLTYQDWLDRTFEQNEMMAAANIAAVVREHEKNAEQAREEVSTGDSTDSADRAPVSNVP
jgi:hypothetical protein